MTTFSGPIPDDRGTQLRSGNKRWVVTERTGSLLTLHRFETFDDAADFMADGREGNFVITVLDGDRRVAVEWRYDEPTTSYLDDLIAAHGATAAHVEYIMGEES